MANLSPMMSQYKEIKGRYQDSIVFFRLGDFYEMFFEDAELAAEELDLVLTGRDCGQEERAPMCGVPYHSAEAYIARLVKKGYRVAICEQLENPSEAKGIVKRDVVRVITPGTVIEDSMLDESKNNFLATIYLEDKYAGLCFVDASTGALNVTEIGGNDVETRIIDEMSRFSPSEVLLNEAAGNFKILNKFIKDRLNAFVEILDEDNFYKDGIIEAQFKIENIDGLGIDANSKILPALRGTLGFLHKTQKTNLANISGINFYNDTQYMKLDINARSNLELLETMRGGNKKGSLLWVIDNTKTAMGKRMMRSFIELPLMNPAEIVKRQNAIEELYSDAILRDKLTEILSSVHDLERIITRIAYGNANARELNALLHALSAAPLIKEKLKDKSSYLLNELHSRIDCLDDICELIRTSIADEPPFSVREGGLIKTGYNKEIDLLREDMTDGKSVITRVEAEEKEKTGIAKLKVGYNRVFGYYIEIPASNKAETPPHYIRKQTLSNCERYITEDLKALEGRVLGAKERLEALEYDVFSHVRDAVAAEILRVKQTAAAIAKTDVLCSFAEIAMKNNYIRPHITVDGKIEINEGRHPVVEKMTETVFVPNDTYLDGGESSCIIITGPNMAGKSTFMRQTALITLLAQTGSFVPAKSAKISIVDAIYTRIGASDDLSAGQSTFMVEMTEVAMILKEATNKSLIILDEIGRGTSTFDGMAIARAVLEYVSDKKKLGAKTLFATHYHELTELENMLANVKNYNIAVKKKGDSIIFLRKIVRGGADDSYGIDVAKLAGVPKQVIDRANEVLRMLEKGMPVDTKTTKKAADENQMGFHFGGYDKYSKLIEEIKTLDVNILTPVEAMTKLNELISEAKEI